MISLHLSFTAISGFGASRQFPGFLSSRYIHIPPLDIHTYLPASWPLINVCVFGFDTTPLFRFLFYLPSPKVLYIEYPTLLFSLHVLSFTSLLYILIVNLCHSLLSDCSILSMHVPPFCDVVVGCSLLIHASRCVFL